MHFEILVEDQSGKKALDILVPKIIGNDHSFRVHSYKGIGHIPKGIKIAKDACTRQLLNKLPTLLSVYGKTFAAYPSDYPAVVIVVCDLDDKCLRSFRQELLSILNHCDPKPETRFCIAVEEGEAWFLGDMNALKTVYPKANEKELNSYSPDSICGTWEKLADVVYPGGAKKLSSFGYQAIGAEKSKWAESIAPLMDIENNTSPSFQYFRTKLRELSSADNIP